MKFKKKISPIFGGLSEKVDQIFLKRGPLIKFLVQKWKFFSKKL
jgi:hypothetical protein